MNNSVTNAMHAFALAIYTCLVYQGLAEKRDYHTVWILLTFLFMFFLKIIGVLVHLPKIEQVRSRHNFFWILISIFFIFLNIVILKALEAPTVIFLLGIIVSLVLSGLYVRTLFTGTGDFYLVAIAAGFMNLLCAYITRDLLQVAWLCVLASNLLWIALSKVDYLRERKFHNDIYHVALIGSTYLLFTSVSRGLWQG